MFEIVLFLLLEFLKRLLVETNRDYSLPFVFTIQGVLYGFFLLFLYIHYDGFAEHYLHEEGAIVITPKNESKNFFEQGLPYVLQSFSGMMLIITLPLSFIHTFLLLKQKLLIGETTYRQIAKSLEWLFLWSPCIIVLTGSLVALTGEEYLMDAFFTQSGLCTVFVFLYLIVLRYKHYVSFKWSSFLLKLALRIFYAAILLGIVILIALSNADLSH